MKRLTTEEFIKRAKKAHRNKYDYSKVIYENCNKKVCIICPKHGEFWQLPITHIKGGGCPKCAGVKKHTTEEFIELAKKVHGDKYDYSKVKYINNKTKVCIICPKHGEFWQTPNTHLSGQGCPKCSYEHGRCNKVSSKTAWNGKDGFIKKADIVHNNKYDYSKVKYINNKTPVCIICPEHGEFWQRPDNHLHGQECPVCKTSKLENDILKWLKNKNIQFEYQKKFEWLKSKQNYLRLDFYIPKYNIAIECQGIQHFEPIDFFGGKKILFSQQKWDKLKKDLCESHNVKLLYYTTTDIKEKYNINNDLISDKRIILKKIKENEQKR